MDRAKPQVERVSKIFIFGQYIKMVGEQKNSTGKLGQEIKALKGVLGQCGMRDNNKIAKDRKINHDHGLLF